jgi:hypothetical protein
MEKYTPEEVSSARERFVGLLDAGDTIYTLITQVSGTGMTRWVRVLVPIMTLDGPRITEVTSLVAILFNQDGSDRRGVKVHGVGMDVTQYLTQRLSYALYGTSDGITHRGL